jgi:hypothetical protein
MLELLQKTSIQSQLQQFLKNNIGPSGRGFTTLELKKAISTPLTTRQLCHVLAELVKLRIVTFTGRTKGKRFVLSKFREIAEDNNSIDYRLRGIPYAYIRFKENPLSKSEQSIFHEFEKVRISKKISLKKFCQSLLMFQKIKLT